MAKVWKFSWIVQSLSLYKVRGQLILMLGGEGLSQKVDEAAMGVQGCSKICGNPGLFPEPLEVCSGIKLHKKPEEDRSVSRGSTSMGS